MPLLNSELGRNIGLLILRVGFGITFIFHGYPKLLAGPDKWEQLGNALAVLGLHFFPTVMGFIAASAEFAGGLLLVLGMCTRTASTFLLLTMFVATAMHVNHGDSFMIYSHALEAAIVFLSLIFLGPGRYSMEIRIQRWMK